jgi:hypothetical protein
VITLITPTADQPTGMALCEKYMARQTIPYDQWIVVDDGVQHAKLTMGQAHIWRERETDCKPAQSLCRNLLGAIPLIEGDIIVVIEHDDHVAQNHVETMVRQLKNALIAGDPKQRYYNVAHRCWRLFDNVGASLCQTAFRRSLLPTFKGAVQACLSASRIGVDRALWDAVQPSCKSLVRSDTVLGIKGLPGRPGIGVGHRPSGSLWTPDPELVRLREWIGADADMYEPFCQVEAAA